MTRCVLCVCAGGSSGSYRQCLSGILSQTFQARSAMAGFFFVEPHARSRADVQGCYGFR